MRAFACALVLPLALLGCASAPPSTWPDAEAHPAAGRAAASALKLVGAPYRYGGASPAGFDCSGLVQYSFRQAGLQLPRSTEAQWLASRPIPASALRPGDLVFFDLNRRKNSHVGIYAGDGEFVHAPSTGKDVRRDRLDSPFWRRQAPEPRRLVF